MKQASLWDSERDRVSAATWKRLPEKVRAEIVAQLVRLVVVSLTDKQKVMSHEDKEKR
jgi:hypothetical protein